MHREEPHCRAESNDFAHTLEEKLRAEGCAPGVDGLVDEGRRPPEVAEVLESDVLRVGAGGVDFWDGVAFEVGVAEVAVGEGVGDLFEPDDDCGS